MNKYTASGQADMIPAANADDVLTTSLNGIPSDINCAIYDGAAKLFGAVWHDQIGLFYFSVRENSLYATPSPVNIVPPVSFDVSSADMVIGAPYSGSTEYYVGIVYNVSAPTLPPQQDILMDIYKIDYSVGFSPSIVGTQLSVPIATNIGGNLSYPRIDIINKQDQGTPSTFYSDKFVITWATSSGMSPTIEACSGSLINVFINGNTGTNITYASNPINDVANVTAGYECDIAGIERGIGGANKDLAYIVFTDNSGLPYISKWDITNNVVTWDNTPKDGVISTPRIDGLDPYTLNGHGDDYCAVWNYDAGGGLIQVSSYATTNGLKTNTQSAINTAEHISTSNALYPTVACSPDTGYSVTFYSQWIENVILESMDWYNAFANNCACTTSSNEDYFQVNATASTPVGAVAYPIASSSAWAYNSTSGNLEPSINLVVWGDKVGVANPSINYKRFTTLSANPFKQPNSVTSTTNEASLSISPNPAYDKLNIEGIDIGTDYTITDVTGRSVQSGKITSTHIVINSLTPGMYIMSMGDQKVKFTKE